jgi:hypothetical protein
MTDEQLVKTALTLLHNSLDKSGYGESVIWQMKLRITRMLHDIVSDGNPESRELESYIIGLALSLLINESQDEEIRTRAQRMLD